MNSDEVAARLKFKGAKSECPMCEATKWSTSEDLAEQWVGGAYKIEVVTLVCRNCGFVRLHDASSLYD
jgi:hypothetical protein